MRMQNVVFDEDDTECECVNDKFNMNSQKGQEEILLVEEEMHSDDKLSLCNKLCFGVGGVPYSLTNTIINFFINVFLLDVAQIRPGYVSIILLVGKVWDGITDPLCGFLINRTNTRLGKYKPWILFSAPFACTAYFFLFYVPGGFTAEMKLVWYLAAYCMFQAFMSGMHVPYTTMTMTVTNSQSERDSVTVYRMVIEATGVILGVAIQSYFVQSKQTGCDHSNTTINFERRQGEEWSYIHGSTTVIIICFVCAAIIFFGVRERKGEIIGEDSGFCHSLKLVFTHGPFLKLSLCYMFHSLASSIIQGNIALYCIHTLKLQDQFAYFIFAILVSAIAFMPVWQIILRKIGKKTSYGINLMLAVPLVTAFLYLPPERPAYMYALMLTLGIALSGGGLLPWSMLPDVLDDFRVTTGTRKDAIFYSFYVFFNKVSAGIGLGVTQLVLE